MLSVLAQVYAQMLLLQNHRGFSNFSIQNREYWRRIAESKGRHSEDLLNRWSGGQLLQVHHRVDRQARNEIRRSKVLAGVGIETLAELGDHGNGHAQPGCLSMAAETGEKIGHRFQCIQQMKRRNAASGTLRLAILSLKTNT